MPINDIISPKRLKSNPIGSVATDSSTYFPISGPMAFTGELLLSRALLTLSLGFDASRFL